MPAVFSAQLQNSNQFRTEMRDFFSIVEESAPFTPHPFAGARIEREPVEAGNNRTTTIRYDHLLAVSYTHLAEGVDTRTDNGCFVLGLLRTLARWECEGGYHADSKVS